MTSDMRILITGATGFIGAALMDRLVASGHDVIGLCSPRIRQDSASTLIPIDITDAVRLRSLFKEIRPNVVVHAAGRAHFRPTDAMSDLRTVNVEGAENVFRSAIDSHAARIIHLSSVLVYGNGAGSPATEDDPPTPFGEYARSKVEAEESGRRICAGTGTTLTILRLAMIPAPKNHSNLVELVRSIQERRFKWVGDGRNYKSLLSVEDAIGAIQRVIAVSEMQECEVYNIASGTVTMREVVDTIATELGRDIPRARIPLSIARAAAICVGGRLGIPTYETLRKFTASTAISNSKFAGAFNFHFRGDILQDLRRFARALQEEGKLA